VLISNPCWGLQDLEEEEGKMKSFEEEMSRLEERVQTEERKHKVGG